MKQISISILLILAFSVVAFADIARPGRSPNAVAKPAAADSNLIIRMDKNAKEAKLIVPREQLKQLRAELEQLDSETDNTAAVSGKSFSRTQTIAAGTLISLAFVFGGMWFVRSGRSPKSISVIIAMIGVGAAATLVYANVGPPPEARVITSKLFDKKMFTPYRFATGKIKVEVSDDTAYQLVVPDVSPNPTGEV